MIPSALGRLGGVRTVSITSNQTNYNLRTALGSPAGAMQIVVKIASGVTISSSSAGVPAFDEGAGWASGTTISIVNAGSIYGAGGNGGDGGAATNLYNPPHTKSVSNASAGNTGGSALKLTAPTTITNASGHIFGGGGGGGGGGSMYMNVEDAESYQMVVGGGGGGGGRGPNLAGAGSGGVATSDVPAIQDNGSAGVAGSFSAGGAGGLGGDGLVIAGVDLQGGSGNTGGDWGTAGSAGSLADDPSGLATNSARGAVGAGGTGGKAVDLNGQTVSWISGNDPSRVKGAVS